MPYDFFETDDNIPSVLDSYLLSQLSMGVYSTNFDIAFDSGEIFYIPTASQWYGFATGVGDNEHILYDDALLNAVTSDPDYIEIKDLLIEHASVEQ